MIEFVLAPDDVARVRFAFSPLWEMVRSLRVLADPSGHALHLPWVRTVRPRLRGLGFETLLDVVLPAGYIPDFLTPPPRTPLPDLGAELATVRATPPEVVAAELTWTAPGNPPRPARRAMAADPEGTLATLADLLERYWEVAVEPFWPRVRDLLEGRSCAAAPRSPPRAPRACSATCTRRSHGAPGRSPSTATGTSAASSPGAGSCSSRARSCGRRCR
ncbi:hypothetical protein ACFQY7_56310 [Actinomadura luteofluorescens]|uniref:hypothetical protein n=1 Tax=Actinomadura luteofluorescens TaxID=46163 RepID=UPI003625A3A1